MKAIRTFVTVAGIASVALSPFATDLPLVGASAAIAKGNDNGGGGGNGGGNGGAKGDGNSAGAKGNAGGKSASAQGSTSKSKATVPTAEAEVASVLPRNHGAIASQLKGLNAYQASATAMENAAPNSQVGRIAAYRDAALATQDAETKTAEAQAALDAATGAVTDLETDLADLNAGYTGRSAADIQADIAALDPTAPDYQDQVNALNGELTSATTYEAQKAAIETAIADAEAAAAEAQIAYDDAVAAAAVAQEVEADALSTAANGRTLSQGAVDYLRSELGL